MDEHLEKIHELYGLNQYLNNLRLGIYDDFEYGRLIRILEDTMVNLNVDNCSDTLMTVWSLPYLHAIYKDRIDFSNDEEVEKYNRNRSNLFFKVEKIIQEISVLVSNRR